MWRATGALAAGKPLPLGSGLGSKRTRPEMLSSQRQRSKRGQLEPWQRVCSGFQGLGWVGQRIREALVTGSRVVDRATGGLAAHVSEFWAKATAFT